MEIKGRIIHVLPLQEGVSKAGNPWKKQEYVLETEEQYPRKVCFNLFGDKVDQYLSAKMSWLALILKVGNLMVVGTPM